MADKEQSRPIKHGIVKDENGCQYCRVADTVLNVPLRRCMSCPLMKKDADSVYCMYCEEEINKHDFPDFVPSFTYVSKDLSDNLIFTHEEGVYEALKTYERSLQFAAMAHKGAFRKSSRIPYIVHPVETSVIVFQLCMELIDKNMGITVEKAYYLACGGALHDIIEDTKYSYDDLVHLFGTTIADYVRMESEDKRSNQRAEDTWHIRKQETLDKLKDATIEGKILTLGDKLSNMQDLVTDYHKQGNDLWQKFNQKDISQQEWYYRGIAAQLSCFEGTNAYLLYNSLCDELFG